MTRRRRFRVPLVTLHAGPIYDGWSDRPTRALGAVIFASPARAAELLAIGVVTFADDASADERAATWAAANPEPLRAILRAWAEGLRPRTVRP